MTKYTSISRFGSNHCGYSGNHILSGTTLSKTFIMVNKTSPDNITRIPYKMTSKSSLLVFLVSTITTTFAFCLLLSNFNPISCSRMRNKLDVLFNHGCPETLPQCSADIENVPATNLFQVTSSNTESPTTKTNFLLSNIGGPPMIIMTTSTQDSELTINWPVILNNGIMNDTNAFHYNHTQDSAIGFMFEKLIVFDDQDKTNTSKFFEVKWDKVVWDLASKTTYVKDDFLKITLRTRPDHPYNNTFGAIQIKMAIPRDIKADRQKEVPHLKLGGQSISVAIIVDNIQPNEKFANPRLLMTFVSVVQGPENAAVVCESESESLISDEYTPGVFKIKSLQFKQKEPGFKFDDRSNSIEPNNLIQNGHLGFFYWKEVAYTDRRKLISRTVDVYDEHKEHLWSTLPLTSRPFYQFFNHKGSNAGQNHLFRINLIFGRGDSVYSATNFTDFSFVLGLGTAPREQIFSFLVKIIIFVCFCLPILVTLAGVGHLLLRRFRRTGDTELLLAHEQS